MNFYVYYKIAPDQTKAFALQVKDLFNRIEKQTGIRGRWMRRRDDPATHMEVFEGVKDEAVFEALLESEGARLGIARKVERFISAEIPS